MATIKNRRRSASSGGRKRSVKHKSGKSLAFLIVVVVLVVISAVIVVFIGEKKAESSITDAPKNFDRKAVVDDDYLHRKTRDDEMKNTHGKTVKASANKHADSPAEKKEATPEYGVKDRDYLDDIIKTR